jgi:RNA polymerase sigma-70 factor (ECF subfamily)
VIRIEEADPLAAAWKAHRNYLVDLAFRMVGDMAEAEDLVQEVFTRMLRVDIHQIDDIRGWLIVVTSRLCLDHIKSARSRRQRPEDLTARPERPTLGRAADVDPADRVTIDDHVRMALLVVLERLSPAERVVFVLHDVFEVPFDSIAETVGRPAASCRQLARRARLKIGDRQALPFSPAGGHRDVTDRFVAALANGDIPSLLQVLDPDVSGGADLRPRLVVRGAQRVAVNLLRYWHADVRVVSYPMGEEPVLLRFEGGELTGVLVLHLRDELITKIHGIFDPGKLAVLRADLAAAD